MIQHHQNGDETRLKRGQGALADIDGEARAKVIAALAAMGNAAPQLGVHIEAGLNVGLSRDEVVEILMPMAVYAGFPAALNGFFAAKEVFERRTQGSEGAA